MPFSSPRSARSANEETARLIQEASLLYGAGITGENDRNHSPSHYGSPRSSSGDNESPLRQPLATEDSVEIIQTESATVQILSDEDGDDDDDDLAADMEGTVGHLTRRLRCLFSAITWPIGVLATLVSFALVWVLYTAFILDMNQACSHPLHWYAVASLVVVSYFPQHHRVRSHIFQYSREHDGPVRPPGVRMYDQLFHTLCIIYVYGGVTLIQTCRTDMGDDGVEDDFNKPTEFPLSVSDDASDTGNVASDANTCAATCPHLYDAMVVYVTTLELFTFALILPLLCLPCIYVWILRRATSESEALAELQERLEEDEALLNNGGGITTQELMDSLEPVRLVSKGDNSVDSDIVLMPARSGSSWSKVSSDAKECCICMTDFVVSEGTDIESGAVALVSSDEGAQADLLLSSDHPPPTPNGPAGRDFVPLDETSMIRTKCGHVFHQKCLAGWIGGRWEPHPTPRDPANESRASRRRRRARRTCCPLCRRDLKPVNGGGLSGSATV